MANNNLMSAKKAKNDEFYTQYHDIEKEFNAYLVYNSEVFSQILQIRTWKRGIANGDLYMIENGIVEVLFARILIRFRRGQIQS